MPPAVNGETLASLATKNPAKLDLAGLCGETLVLLGSYLVPGSNPNYLVSD